MECRHYTACVVVAVLAFSFSSVATRANTDDHCGLWPKWVNGSFGFADASGSVVIAPRYDDVNMFEEGVAAVCRGGRWGIVDVKGREIVPPKYEQILDGSSEGLIPVLEAGKWTFINRRGTPAFNETFDKVGGFSEGYAGVEVHAKWGFIDKTGKLVIPAEFNWVGPFNEGLAAVKSGGGWGYIDTSGKARIAPQYELAHSFASGIAAVMKDSKIGFIDTGGAVVIPFQFQEASTKGFSEGVCTVRFMQKWGTINFVGEWVVEPVYDRLGNCMGGTALAEADGRRHDIKLADALREWHKKSDATSKPTTR